MFTSSNCLRNPHFVILRFLPKILIFYFLLHFFNIHINILLIYFLYIFFNINIKEILILKKFTFLAMTVLQKLNCKNPRVKKKKTHLMVCVHEKNKTFFFGLGTIFFKKFTIGSFLVFMNIHLKSTCSGALHDL